MSDLQIRGGKIVYLNDNGDSVYDLAETATNITLNSGIATMHITSAINDNQDNRWQLHNWAASDIDTFGNVANTTDNRFDIPTNGYYEIYYQVYVGVTGEQDSLRDFCIVISRTSGGVESVISSTHNRFFENAASGTANDNDTSDHHSTTHAIVQCSAGDQIKMYYYANTDTGTAYDVYAKIGEEDNTHIYEHISSASSISSVAIPKATHCWLKKIAELDPINPTTLVKIL